MSGAKVTEMSGPEVQLKEIIQQLQTVTSQRDELQAKVDAIRAVDGMPAFEKSFQVDELRVGLDPIDNEIERLQIERLKTQKQIWQAEMPVLVADRDRQRAAFVSLKEQFLELQEQYNLAAHLLNQAEHAVHSQDYRLSDLEKELGKRVRELELKRRRAHAAA
jgi:chromosome segregation ATPase